MAQLDKTPRGETERIAKELKRTYNAIQFQIIEMRRDKSWKQWIDYGNHDFARFHE